MECCKYRYAWMLLWALAVTSGYDAYYLDLLPSLRFSLMQDLMSHAYTQLCTDSLILREMAQGDGSICVCVRLSVCLSVYLSVCERLYVCMSVSVSVCACILCIRYVRHTSCVHVCVCVYVSCCVCIVYTWMSRCLWYGMIYVCTCECVHTLPVCLSVRVCVQVATVCVCMYVCQYIVHVARTW